MKEMKSLREMVETGFLKMTMMIRDLEGNMTSQFEKRRKRLVRKDLFRNEVLSAFSNIHAAISIDMLLPIARETINGDATISLPITKSEQRLRQFLRWHLWWCNVNPAVPTTTS
jgi:hypothetical protein